MTHSIGMSPAGSRTLLYRPRPYPPPLCYPALHPQLTLKLFTLKFFNQSTLKCRGEYPQEKDFPGSNSHTEERRNRLHRPLLRLWPLSADPAENHSYPGVSENPGQCRALRAALATKSQDQHRAAAGQAAAWGANILHGSSVASQLPCFQSSFLLTQLGRQQNTKQRFGLLPLTWDPRTVLQIIGFGRSKEQLSV